MRDYIVSGVPLRDPVGRGGSPVYYMDYTRSDLGGDVSRAITNGPEFGYHGAVPDVDNYFGTSRETLTLNLEALDKDEYGLFYKGFAGLFSRRDFQVLTAPQRSPLVAGSGRDGRSFNVSSDLVREARMRMVGSMAEERLNERTSRIKIILENIWGFYRSVNDYTSSPVTINAASTAVPLSVAGDSTAPLVAGLVRVRGPVAANGVVRLLDLNSPKGIGFKALTALGSTEYVIIDLQTLKATKVTTDTWNMNSGIAVNTSVDPNGEGAVGFDPGAPAGGWPSNTFAYGYTLQASGYTAGSTAVEVRVKRSYLA